MDNFPEIADIEVLELRKKVKELQAKLHDYERILHENGLLEKVSQLSDTEIMCTRELQRFNELSAKGGGLTIEDAKIVDILHKNLLMARGKPVEEDKKKKGKNKDDKHDVAKLLQIVEAKE